MTLVSPLVSPSGFPSGEPQLRIGRPHPRFRQSEFPTHHIGALATDIPGSASFTANGESADLLASLRRLRVVPRWSELSRRSP
jgi:hypothetical protein